MKNKGFSLVELIVVIAIMAILVGVAVPVYSSYIEKTQKAADENLADEIKHAIEIGLIANKPEGFKGGVVVKLSATGATVTNGSADDIAFVEGILAQTFGSSWATELKLKYDGWKSGTAQTVVANYAGSSFDGNEKELLGQIQTLTSALSDVVASNTNIIGSSFGSYLVDDLGIDKSDSTKVGNAAVLYVADKTSGCLSDDEMANNFVNAWVSGNYSLVVGEIGAASQAAATYAQNEAMLQYLVDNAQSEGAKTEAQAALDAWHGIDFTGCPDITDEENGVLAVVGTTASDAFGGLLGGEFGDDFEALMDTYFDEDAEGNSAAKTDAKAYLAALNAVMDADELVINNLGNNDCYTNEALLNAVTAYITVGSVGIQNGEMAVVINCDADGLAQVLIYPIDVIED